MAEKMYSGQDYQTLSNATNLAQLWAAQGVGNDYLQSLAAGTTFETGGAEVGYKWKVVPTAKGNTVELLDNWTKTPVTQTQALSYVMTPNPSKQQTYVYDMNQALNLVQSYSKAGLTNMQIVYVSPDGDPFKRRVYDITPSQPNGVYSGPTNVTGPTAGTATTPESLINSLGQPTQFTPITHGTTTPAVTGTTTQTGTPVPTAPPVVTPINQQITKDAATGAETATTVPPSTTTPTWGNMDTTPIDTTSAANITWRTLPSEIKTFPFWQAGASTSGANAGSTASSFPQFQYSNELFSPSAQLWSRYSPSERQSYQSAVTGTGLSWDDMLQSLQKKWGAVTPTTSQGRFNWTPSGYNR